MQKIKRILITFLCVAFLLSFSAFVIYRDQQYQQLKAQVFDRSFGTQANLFSNARTVFLPEYPSYCITEEGILCVPDFSTEEMGVRQVGELLPFQLTQRNFDDCVADGHAADAATIRSHTVSAWKAVTEGGELYYLILLENGDVFLAIGQEADTVSLYEVYQLNNVGTTDVFLNTYSN